MITLLLSLLIFCDLLEKERKLKHGQMSSIDLTNSFSVSHIPDAPLHVPLPSLPDNHLHTHNKIIPITKSRDSFLEEEKERDKLREKEEQLRKKEVILIGFILI